MDTLNLKPKSHKNQKWLFLIIAIIVAATTFAVIKLITTVSDESDDNTAPAVSTKENFKNSLPELEQKASGSSDSKDYSNYAAALRATGDLKKSKEMYERSYELAPTAATAASLATVYRDLKETDQAIEYYKKSLEIDPTYMLAITQLSQVYEAKDEVNLAIELLKNAITAAGSDTTKQENFSLQLANLYNRLGNTTEARSYYEKVIKLNPNNAAAKAAL
ncbi:tetratricopeptide repeat protein [Candidatus Saccharibacteria bacterium]|nr:tetratricopeptide repeat protein [Candidatus Saccharibacteria bacterium]